MLLPLPSLVCVCVLVLWFFSAGFFLRGASLPPGKVPTSVSLEGAQPCLRTQPEPWNTLVCSLYTRATSQAPT